MEERNALFIDVIEGISAINTNNLSVLLQQSPTPASDAVEGFQKLQTQTAKYAKYFVKLHIA